MRNSLLVTLLVIGVSAGWGNYCSAQIGRTYSLLRTDANNGFAITGSFAHDGTNTEWHVPPSNSNNMLAHSSSSDQTSGENAFANALSTASSLLTTPSNATSWNANSTACVFVSVAASGDGGPSYAGAQGFGRAVANGSFKVVDFAVPDSNKRPALVGALYVLINPSNPTRLTAPFLSGDDHFSLIAGHSNLYGDWEGPATGWHVTGSLASLDNPSKPIDMFWPSSMNHLFLFSHGATVDATYTTKSELDFGAMASDNGIQTDSGLYSSSIASWFYVEEWELSSTDPYEGQVVASPDASYFPGDIDVLAPEDNPDHPDHDPQP